MDSHRTTRSRFDEPPTLDDDETAPLEEWTLDDLDDALDFRVALRATGPAAESLVD